MDDEAERLQILEMIEKGTITPSQGIKLLEALQGGVPAELLGAETAQAVRSPAAALPSASAAFPSPEPIPAEEESDRSAPTSLPADADKWRGFWWIPMLIGTGIVLVSGLLIFLVWLSARAINFWHFCLAFPLLFGLAVMALSLASRTARWLHVRVHQAESPRTIAISLPLPLRLTAFGVRIVRPFIPELRRAKVDEMILALQNVSPQEPFHVSVDEGEDGEKVEVYIG